MAETRALFIGNQPLDALSGHLAMLSLVHKKTVEEAIARPLQRLYSSTFIHKSDSFGDAHLFGLMQAAQAGYDVRYLIDGYGFHLSDEEIQLLLQAGVQLAEFHPWPRNKKNAIYDLFKHPSRTLRKLLYRMHDKILVSEDYVKIGDRNIEAGHYHLDAEPIMSREFLVQDNNLADQVSDYYLQIFNSPMVIAITTDELKHVSDADLNTVWQRIQKNANALNLSTDPQILQRLKNSSNFKFIHKSVSKLNVGMNLQEWLLDFITSSQQIWIENAYVTFPSKVRQQLKNAAAKGIPITILTNSLETIDTAKLAAGWAFERKQLSAAPGIAVFEKSSPYLHHSKTYLNDKKVAIGSVNGNHRSLQNVNFDVMLETEDPSLREQVLKEIKQNLISDYTQILPQKNCTTPLTIPKHLKWSYQLRKKSHLARKFLTY